MNYKYLFPVAFAAAFGGTLAAYTPPEFAYRHERIAQSTPKVEKPWFKVYTPVLKKAVVQDCCDYPRAPVWCPMWRIGQAYPYDHVEVPSSADYLRDLSVFGAPRCHEVIEFPSQRNYEFRIEYEE